MQPASCTPVAPRRHGRECVRCRRPREPVGGCEVPDEALTEIGQLADHHDRLTHAGVNGDCGGDFSEFDPEAADLHLLVGAADEFDVTVGVTAGEVTRPVEPGAGCERIRDEPFGGQPGPR